MATKPKKDAFGIDADPAEFDIEEWLSGASLPERSVKIFQDAAARARLDELAEEFEALGRKVNDNSGTSPDTMGDSLGEGGALGQQYAVAEQMDAIIKATEKTAVWVRVRSMTADEMVKVQKKNLDDVSLYPEILSVVGRVSSGGREAPKMTATKWMKFRNTVGDKQFKKIVAAVDDASGWGGSEQVMPDFLPDVSALLSMKES